MKTSLLRLALAAAALGLAPLATATDSAPADRAAETLAGAGMLKLSAAGPYVEAGTFRVQVAAKLGAPDLRLRDGTWLYHGHRVQGSEARGTLVVRFEGGRVSALTLVTPAVATAMRNGSAPAAAKELLATK